MMNLPDNIESPTKLSRSLYIPQRVDDQLTSWMGYISTKDKRATRGDIVTRMTDELATIGWVPGDKLKRVK